MLRYDPSVGGVGTPGYSAPECFRMQAHVTSKADVWSAGVILYQMTYGIPPPYPSAQPPPRSHGTRSGNVEQILNGCLQYDAHRRVSHNWLAQHPYTNNRSAL